MQRDPFPVDDVTHIDGCRDLFLDGLQRPQRFPGRIRTPDANIVQRLVQPPPIAAAMGLVIQLWHHVAGINRICRDVGRVNVVRMPGAVRVVSDDDLWPVMLDELPDPVGNGLDGHAAERVVVLLGAPPRHAGIAVTEQLEMRDSQVCAGAMELILTDRRHRTGIMAVLARLDTTWPITEFPIGTRDDNRPHSPQCIVRKDAAGRGGLVVGMGMDGHQGQLFDGHHWSVAHAVGPSMRFLLWVALECRRMSDPVSSIRVVTVRQLIPQGLAEVVCQRMLPRASRLTTGELAARIKKITIAFDPDWAARRYACAVQDRDVVGYLNDDGTATVTGHQLPTDQAASACARIEDLAKAANEPDIPVGSTPACRSLPRVAGGPLATHDPRPDHRRLLTHAADTDTVDVGNSHTAARNDDPGQPFSYTPWPAGAQHCATRSHPGSW